ncbi:RNA pseudouridylate synthase domain containing protein 2 [Chytridiales sp. JEL 0842]|nr:RNA pseudouridylate synthase domain containing protein 2 [Chytridiales sp. JEL 0842]
MDLKRKQGNVIHERRSKTKKAKNGQRRSEEELMEPEFVFEGGLRKVKPYWFVYKTHAKGRWLKRTLHDVFSIEFQDQPSDYYKRAILAGKITVNGQKVQPNYIIKNGDLIAHTIHRHEPPVTADPIKIVYQDEELLVVDKPASVPVHATGRYHYNTIVGILQSKEFGFKTLYPCNRLDRLTSGILLIALKKERAAELTKEMTTREIQKTYLCRVKGEFPAEEIECNEPILTVSFKLGINIVSPDGKHCRTHFKRLSTNGLTSVVLCKPYTGRTHQIRVHLQYLGYPIANDPLYCTDVWGESGGKGGIKEEERQEVVERIEKVAYPFAEVKPAGEESNAKDGKEGGADEKPAVLDVQEQKEMSNEKDGTDPLSLSDFPCIECALKRMDPIPDQLQIYLHSFKYSGGDWEYETGTPMWADEGYTGDKVLAERFWRFGGRWDGKAPGEVGE